MAGFAASETVGAGSGGGAFTLTITDCSALPPAPLQTKVNLLVVVSAPTASLPEVALVPDQAPPALQALASVDDQLKVEEPFMSTVVGLAVSETVGAGGGGSPTTATVIASLALTSIGTGLPLSVNAPARSPLTTLDGTSSAAP
jgi:hypothetical protein